MGFLKSLAQTVVGASPYALSALRQNQAENDAEDDRLRANFSKTQADDRAERQQSLADQLGQRTLRTPVLGDAQYAPAMGAVAGAEANAKVPSAVFEAQQLAPIKVKEATDTASALSPITTSTAANTARAVSPITTQTAVNTERQTAPIKTAQAIATAKGTADYAAPIAAVDPATGVTKYMTRSDALNKDKAAATGAGAQNAPQMAAAKTNMEAAMKIMDDYEAKLKAGTAKYGVLDATMGAMASSPAALNTKGLTGGVESLAANAASSRLQNSNPELTRYLTAKKYIAEAILNTHKRPNQTQYEIEQEISGAGPNPQGMQIDMAANRRKNMYNEVFNNPNAGGAVAPGPRATSQGAPQTSGTHTVVINGKSYVVPD